MSWGLSMALVLQHCRGLRFEILLTSGNFMQGFEEISNRPLEHSTRPPNQQFISGFLFGIGGLGMPGGYFPWGFVGDFLEGLWTCETSAFSAPENSICLEDPKHIPFVAKGFWGLFPEAKKTIAVWVHRRVTLPWSVCVCVCKTPQEVPVCAKPCRKFLFQTDFQTANGSCRIDFVVSRDSKKLVGVGVYPGSQKP